MQVAHKTREKGCKNIWPGTYLHPPKEGFEKMRLVWNTIKISSPYWLPHKRRDVESHCRFKEKPHELLIYRIYWFPYSIHIHIDDVAKGFSKKFVWSIIEEASNDSILFSPFPLGHSSYGFKVQAWNIMLSQEGTYVVLSFTWEGASVHNLEWMDCPPVRVVFTGYAYYTDHLKILDCYRSGVSTTCKVVASAHEKIPYHTQ